MHHQATLPASNRPQTLGCWVVGIVQKGGVLHQQDAFIGLDALQGAVLMRQEQVCRRHFRVCEQGVRCLGRLPIATRLVNRRLRLGTKGFGDGQHALVQACITQFQAPQLAYTPACVHLLDHCNVHSLVPFLRPGVYTTAGLLSDHHGNQLVQKIPVTVSYGMR